MPLRRSYSLAATLAFAGAVATLAGCAVGPDYHRPDAPTASSYKETPAGWKLAEPADRTDRGNWWSIYGDARLDALMDQLGTSNQTIAQYAAAYRQARALVAEARAAYFPTSASGA